MSQLTVSDLVIQVSRQHEQTSVHPSKIVLSRDEYEQLCKHNAQELLDIQTLAERVLYSAPRQFVTHEDVKPITAVRCLFCADMVTINVKE